MTRSAAATRAYYRRERVRSLRTAKARLSGTHRWDAGTSPIDTDAFFDDDDREAEITFAWSFMVTDALAEGVMFDIGDNNTGMACWVKSERLGAGVGYKPRVLPAGDQTWVRQRTPIGEPIPVNRCLDVVFSARPGDGTMRLWLNGEQIFNQQSSAGDFNGIGDNVWSSFFGNGSFFGAPVSLWRGSDTVIAPNASLVSLSPLMAYRCQRPWHYDTGPQDAPIGGPGGGGAP